MMHKKSPFLLALFSLLVLMYSCEEKIEFDEKNTKSVTYEFYDSSVPPEYHRSYEIFIDVAKATVNINVHAYGDVLQNVTLDYSTAQSKELFEKLNAVNPSCKIPKPEPCSGGTGERLIIQTSETKYDMYLDHCGSTDNYPKSCGDTEGLITFIKSLIPNLAELLQ